MSERRFILNAGRTSKQGVQINVGKHQPEYEAIVNTMTMHADDMQELNIPQNGKVRVWCEFGEANFICQAGKVPVGMIFVPYGPPTCRLMTGDTEGTGMPISKGQEVQVELLKETP